MLALALLQQLRGLESERSFLREAARFFSHLFPGVAGLHPSSFHRRVRRLGRFLEPLRRAVLGELVGDPETLVVDSTLLAVLHPRQAGQSAGWAASSSGAARRLLGDLAYRSGGLESGMAERGVLLVTERSRQGGKRQQAEVAFAALKRTFGLGETTLAKTLVGLVTRIAAKMTAYTYAFYVNRLLGRPQGRIKKLWA